MSFRELWPIEPDVSMQRLLLLQKFFFLFYFQFFSTLSGNLKFYCMEFLSICNIVEKSFLVAVYQLSDLCRSVWVLAGPLLCLCKTSENINMCNILKSILALVY